MNQEQHKPGLKVSLGTARRLAAYLDGYVAGLAVDDPRHEHFTIPLFYLFAERLRSVESRQGFPPAVYAIGATALANECALAGLEQHPVAGIPAEITDRLEPGDSGVIRLASVDFARKAFGNSFADQVAALYFEDDRRELGDSLSDE